MMAVRSDIVKQELNDFKDEVVSRFTRLDNKLDKIDEKVSFTNGKIAGAIVDIQLNKSRYTSVIHNCDKNHPPLRDWKMMIITAIVGILAVIITNRILG